jgi:dienelactone hydrolase
VLGGRSWPVAAACLTNRDRRQRVHSGVRIYLKGFGYGALFTTRAAAERKLARRVLLYPQAASAWTTLGLRPGASRAAIERAWGRARSRHHPDKGGRTENFARVKAAYESLTAT